MYNKKEWGGKGVSKVVLNKEEELKVIFLSQR